MKRNIRAKYSLLWDKRCSIRCNDPGKYYGKMIEIGENPGPTELRIASVNVQVVAFMDEDLVKT